LPGITQLDSGHNRQDAFIAFAYRLAEGDNITISKKMRRFWLEHLGELVSWLADVGPVV